MQTTRIKIETIDRPYMTYDILSVLVKYELSVTWMEVYTYVVYIKLPKIDSNLWKAIKSEILEIPGVKSVTEIDLIDFEKREIEKKAILDLLPYGILLLDKEKRIKYINKFAAKTILMTDEHGAIDKSIWDFIPRKSLSSYIGSDLSFYDDIENIEIRLKNKSYLMDIYGLKTEEGAVFGYIFTMQDSGKISEIINLKRYDNPITFDDIIGSSAKHHQVIEQAKVFSQSDSPVLILGESGTGKELFARAIHNASLRSSKPFIPVNCAAVPDQLLESELFGYEEGAFTGAKKHGKTGIFEIANGGTIFLDEIGEMPPHLQAKLLRVLQESKIRKVGSNTFENINVKVITATNKNLYKMVEDGQFRLDLLYRINTFSLTVPPLRERREDINELIEHFIKIYSGKYGKKINGIAPQALKKLLAYNWPGNVRELQNVLERAIAFTKGNEIDAEDIVLNNLSVQNQINESMSLKNTLDEVERNIILNTLKHSSSIREAARTLQVTHTMLINRIKKYGIKNSEWRFQNE
ncbi:ATPase AAA [Tepidanaerobacter syntrophicus]|uniref:sigma 54-interacting transcriptional regulator n=1 Tax=Tepidanaerobacter syntrophicus TaxID=224999 RepID=UPI0022EE247B|nr:sigma 54-interacting transcriptional regulator [Tepidanaerobacter syntrophicus]GLI51526.1 ATPase AAA [Tepidanaerobacter syntrophicus]